MFINWFSCILSTNLSTSTIKKWNNRSTQSYILVTPSTGHAEVQLRCSACRLQRNQATPHPSAPATPSLQTGDALMEKARSSTWTGGDSNIHHPPSISGSRLSVTSLDQEMIHRQQLTHQTQRHWSRHAGSLGTDFIWHRHPALQDLRNHRIAPLPCRVSSPTFNHHSTTTRHRHRRSNPDQLGALPGVTAGLAAEGLTTEGPATKGLANKGLATKAQPLRTVFIDNNRKKLNHWTDPYIYILIIVINALSSHPQTLLCVLEGRYVATSHSSTCLSTNVSSRLRSAAQRTETRNVCRFQRKYLSYHYENVYKLIQLHPVHQPVNIYNKTMKQQIDFSLTYWWPRRPALH